MAALLPNYFQIFSLAGISYDFVEPLTQTISVLIVGSVNLNRR